MTMYDEGMMDEGAASLRDRDMIAGKRGGPSVRPWAPFSFFHTGPLTRPRVPRPPLLFSPLVTKYRMHAHAGEVERTPVTGLTDLVVISYGRGRTTTREAAPLRSPRAWDPLCPVHAVCGPFSILFDGFR